MESVFQPYCFSNKNITALFYGSFSLTSAPLLHSNTRMDNPFLDYLLSGQLSKILTWREKRSVTNDR